MLLEKLNHKVLTILPTRLRRPFLVRKLLELSLQQKQTLMEPLIPSNTPLDVVIPLIERELPIFQFVVDGLRKNLYHPINKIIVLGPETKSIIDTCKTLKIDFVPEDEVLHVKKRDLQPYFNARSGWWFQQFLKLHCFPLIQTEHYLILDADTVLLRPHIFLQDNKRVFNISDEFHRPYHEGHHYLMGDKTQFPFSFVSHMMCFDKKTIQDFHQKIQHNHQKSLPEAIIKMLSENPHFSFSEYESFGHYYLSMAKENVILKYWFNRPMIRAKMGETLHQKLQANYRSVSYHNYLK